MASAIRQVRESKDDFVRIGGKNFRVLPSHKENLDAIQAMFPNMDSADVVLFTSRIGSILANNLMGMLWTLVNSCEQQRGGGR